MKFLDHEGESRWMEKADGWEMGVAFWTPYAIEVPILFYERNMDSLSTIALIKRHILSMEREYSTILRMTFFCICCS